MEEVKKRSKKDNFYLIVFQKIKAGLRPSQICKELNISKQNIKYYTDRLKKDGYIEKKGYGTWAILKEVKDFSLGMGLTKPETDMHALQITFPILSGTIEDSAWEIKNKLKNWLPKYKGLTNLGGLTLRNNNNKSLTIFAKSRRILDLAEVDNLAFKIRAFVYEYFLHKHGVVLDVLNCKVTNLNLATEDKASESMIRKGEMFQLNLNKKAEKIFPKDNMDAWAKIDGSPFKFSAETDDKEWKREYLHMPFRIRNLDGSMFLLNQYNKNLELHIKVQKEQLKTQKAIQHLLRGSTFAGKSKKSRGIQKTLYDFF